MKLLNNKSKAFRFFAVAALLFFICFLISENSDIKINEITVENKNIPNSFSGYRIAQISDLHNAEFGKDNIKLISMLEAARPDIIVITGDLIDSRRTDTDIAVSFAEKAVKLAPVYFVTGNHESRIEDYTTLKERLITAGVTVLENSKVTIEKDGDYITLIGINDPDFTQGYYYDSQVFSAADSDGFTVVLSHRPELLEIYSRARVDLAFSGHAHGGQIRLPFVGGLYAPHQGFLPEFDSGVYTKDNTTMVVSRGLGNSIFPLRINNNPEIVVVELKN